MKAAKNETPNSSSNTLTWLVMGLSAIFAASLTLRFWGLGRFNALVFDEVYYAKFANNYLTGTKFFNAHPPLSQYIIAIGIWLGSLMPIGQDTINELTGSIRSTFSYRWLNALTGSFIPLVVAALAYQLSPRWSYALVAGLFAAVDGLFLVESRYALNNVYLVILGLLGHLCLLLALKSGGRWRSFQLALSGIFFGSTAAIKWNGLWFLLGIYLIWAIARVVEPKIKPEDQPQTIFANLRQINLWQFLAYFALLPVVTYSLLWIPHLIMNPEPNFWQSQLDILSFHERIGSSADVHPYCSTWYSWLIMWRPVAYFYDTARSLADPVPQTPPLPPGEGGILYAVHAMGNPFLWWLSTAAILLLVMYVLGLVWLWLISPGRGWTAGQWLVVYVVSSWAANLLPWTRVSRCIFLYHYMGAAVFASLGLAWVVDRWLRSGATNQRIAGIAVLILVVAAFVYWMPIYLGLPLSSIGYQARMWLRSWI